jgi:hypothetical protein
MCFFDFCCKSIDNESNKRNIYWDDELNCISQQFALIRANTHSNLTTLENKNKRIKDNNKPRKTK